MRTEPKRSLAARVLLLALLIALASYATLYTISAYSVATRWACGTAWCCMGAIDNATFFPWPRGPLGVCAEVITKMNSIDEFIYLYLIRTWLLVVICICLWIVVAVYFLKAILPFLKRR
ncbi:MAG: hypothetical protein QXJ02_02055 [Candidatus Bathyarchaeia archaeon]